MAAAIALTMSARTGNAQCRAADSTSAKLVKHWRNLVVNPDSRVRLALSDLGITQVDSSTIVLVGDRTSCTKAVKTYNATLGASSPPPSGSVYLLKVGTRYVVLDPAQQSSGWYHVVIMDNKFVKISNFMG
jgi:hypothetical protein